MLYSCSVYASVSCFFENLLVNFKFILLHRLKIENNDIYKKLFSPSAGAWLLTTENSKAAIKSYKILSIFPPFVQIEIPSNLYKMIQ